MKTETRVVRPFLGLDGAEEALEKVRFVVDGDEKEPSEHDPTINVTLTDEELAAASVVLHLPSADEVRSAVAKTDIAYVDCQFVLLARARTHRLSEVLYRAYLSRAEIPAEFTLDRDKFPTLLRDKSGFDITVAVVLAHNHTPRPLRPFMPGTWLARRDLHVRPERSEALFSPEPLTPELRKEFVVPQGATTYIHLEDGFKNAEPLSDSVRVFVDESVLNTLLQNPKLPISELLQRELAITTMLTLAQEALRQVDDGHGVTEEMLENYPGLASFFRRIATSLKMSVPKVIEAAQTGDRLRTHLAGAFESLKWTESVLKGEDE